MTTDNENPKPADTMDELKKQNEACGAGCGCHATGAPGRTRWVIGTIVLLAAAALVARAITKNNGTKPAAPASGFAAVQATGQMPAAAPVAAAENLTIKELGALNELNTVAADTDGVFVFLPGKIGPSATVPTAQIQSTVKTLAAQGRKIAVFTLNATSPDYAQIASQTPVPGVLAMVKGAGMSATSGEITETKLVQAFVAASRSGGCGPAAGSCGPASAGCK